MITILSKAPLRKNLLTHLVVGRIHFLESCCMEDFSFFLKGLREHLRLAHFLPQPWNHRPPVASGGQRDWPGNLPGGGGFWAQLPTAPRCRDPASRFLKAPLTESYQGSGEDDTPSKAWTRLRAPSNPCTFCASIEYCLCPEAGQNSLIISRA